MPKALTALPDEGSQVRLISMEESIVAGAGVVGNRKPPEGAAPPGTSEQDLPSGLVKIISTDLTENIQPPFLSDPYRETYEGKRNLGDWAGANIAATHPLVKKKLVWPLTMLAPVVPSKANKPEAAGGEQLAALEDQFEFDGLVAFGPVTSISTNAVQYQRVLVKESQTTLLSAKFSYVVPSIELNDKPLELLWIGSVKVNDAEGGIILVSLVDELPIVIFGPPRTCPIGGPEALVSRATVPVKVKSLFDDAIKTISKVTIDTT